jgi:hypothetical protein|eukprot:COSAG06_NODE_3205_length_5685_cov_9.491049_2_plen_433_part_00
MAFSAGARACAAPSLLLLLLALLAATPAATVAWSQLGRTMSRERVTAISMDFGPDGFPVFAYGWNDTDAGGNRGTRIPVMAWNGEDWIEVYHRTSQFPQGYHEFDLKARNGGYYLGLKIHYRYGSVLNSEFEWRGSYAFHNQLFDYEIEENGDMMMLWISSQATGGGYPGTNNDLSVIRYLERGWSGYPAGPDFGEQLVIDRQEPNATSTVSSIRIKSVGKDSGGHPKYLSAWVHGEEMHLAQGSIRDGFTRLGLATEAAETVNVAVHGGQACAAYHPARGGGGGGEDQHEVVVECSACTVEGCDAWRSLGIAIESAAVVERLAVEVVITDDGKVVVAGRKVGSPNTLAVRWREIAPAAAAAAATSANATGSSGSAAVSVAAAADDEEGWTEVDLSVDQTMTHFELGASGNAVYAAISENEGEGIRVMQLVL